jgi:hypothetical protein
MSDAHARQVAIYAHGTNDAAGIAYCTPAKVGIYKLEDAGAHIAAVVNIAKRMEAFLAASDDPHALAAMVVPDFEHFFWNEPHTRALGREIYGF